MELLLRVLSAVAVAAMVLTGLALGPPASHLVVLIAGAIAAWEFAAMAGGGGSRGRSVATISLWVATTGSAVALAAFAGRWEAALALCLAGSIVAAAIAVVPAGARLRWFLGGLLYISVPCVAFVWVRGEGAADFGRLCWLLAVVWTTDIAAYFVGRRFGARKLAPSISPGKTWAGFWGGLGLATAIGGLGAWFLVPFAWVLPYTVLAALLSLVSQMGDLYESSIKRHFGFKDSGRIMPGHGGLLDRIDGLLAATPVYAIVLWSIEMVQ